MLFIGLFLKLGQIMRKHDDKKEIEREAKVYDDVN